MPNAGISGQFKAKSRWGTHRLDEDVYTLALERTRRAFEMFDHVFVAFSGGKDSTVVLNVAIAVAEELGQLPLRVVHWDEEAIPYETEDYVRRVSLDPRVSLEWLCLPVQHRNACSKDSPFWWPWAPESEELWVRPLPPEAITDVEGFPVYPAEARPSVPESSGLICPADRYGSTGMLMGIRAAESLTRNRAVRSRREENYIIPAPSQGPNLFKVYPVYDWTTEDVWTAPALLGWDTNAAYDLMEMCGITHHAQRCAPPYGEEPMQKLWVFKQCFPDVWDRMAYRVPGAATAALYADTELYSFGSIPDKPAELTWQEWIRQRVEQHTDPQVRQAVAYRIARYIKMHYSKTPDPILEVDHPVSGLSWPWLWMLADRADLKQRRTTNLVADPTKYYEALDAHRAEQGEEDDDGARAAAGN